MERIQSLNCHHINLEMSEALGGDVLRSTSEEYLAEAVRWTDPMVFRIYLLSFKNTHTQKEGCVRASKRAIAFDLHQK